jgi:hypothetical protein
MDGLIRLIRIHLRAALVPGLLGEVVWIEGVWVGIVAWVTVNPCRGEGHHIVGPEKRVKNINICLQNFTFFFISRFPKLIIENYQESLVSDK